MPRRKRGERVLGPYPHRRKWRLRIVAANGERRSRTFATRERAEIYKRSFEEDVQESPTVGVALDAYEKHLTEKGNKPNSVKLTTHRLRRFFAKHLEYDLSLLTRGEGERMYTALRATGVSPDTHRNSLIEARSFLRWCGTKAWLEKNPLDGIEGVGRRSHGKAQLRIDEARLWEAKALELAYAGELGAVAALMALKMGLRASEITTRIVRDLDDGGRLLWIPDAKTRAGRRTVAVHPSLVEFLLEATQGKSRQSPIFQVPREGRPPGFHWRDWPREWVQRICELAAVPVVTAHGMRGLCATLSSIEALAGVAPDLEAIAKRFGHTSYRVTAQSYADREAVERAKVERSWKVLDGGASPQKKKRSR